MPGLDEGVGRTSPATGMAKGTFHERQWPRNNGTEWIRGEQEDLVGP
jgi:hypothetical protein